MSVFIFRAILNVDTVNISEKHDKSSERHEMDDDVLAPLLLQL